MLTGRNKDLIFRSSGSGRIKINGDDIRAVKQENDDNASLSPGNTDVSLDYKTAVANRMDALSTRFMMRLEELSQKHNKTFASQSSLLKKQNRRMKSLYKRLTSLEKVI